MHVVDAFIHVRERLDAAGRKLLDEQLRQIPGVIAPWFSPERRHLLLIYYNPARINATALLSRVRAMGYRAKLFGL